MTDGMGSFQERIARIKAAKTEGLCASKPALASAQMAHVSPERRRMTNPSFTDYANDLFDIPTVRYGLPVLIGVLGFALISAFFPAGIQQVGVENDAHIERFDGAPAIVANEVAMDRIITFAKLTNDFDTLEGAYTLNK